jgi:ribonuclease G
MFHRKIYLKSGGYIILEQTEAMMVVDVNSGRYKGSNEQEINALHTNIESAREIARQLKLRDVGGLVAIDFIDMQDDRNKRKIYDEMRRLLLTDKAKTVVLPMSQFCILQITRQRIRNQVVNSMSETCRTCDGRGFVHSKPLIMKRIEQWLHDFKQNTKDFRLSLSVNPSMMDYITEGNISRLTKLMMKNFVRIKLIPDETLPIHNLFKI